MDGVIFKRERLGRIVEIRVNLFARCYRKTIVPEFPKEVERGGGEKDAGRKDAGRKDAGRSISGRKDAGRKGAGRKDGYRTRTSSRALLFRFFFWPATTVARRASQRRAENEKDPRDGWMARSERPPSEPRPTVGNPAPYVAFGMLATATQLMRTCISGEALRSDRSS